MKKFFVSLIMVILIINLAAGCKSDEKNIIYEPGSELTIVYSEDVSSDVAENLSATLTEIRSEEVKVETSNSSKKKFEIVLGNTNREVSKQAYKRLLSVNKENSQFYGYVIYCDENSIAIAYDVDRFKTDYTLNKAISLFLEKYATGKTLSIDKGLVENGTVNIVEEQRKQDEIKRESDWIRLENQLINKGLSSMKAKSIVYSFKQLYTNIDSDVVTWLANLYDVGRGFYYSNSGRDTVGYGPDIESTNQAIGILQSSGILREYSGDPKKGLPASFVEDVGLWVKSLQHPNGYFYHPQWSKEEVDSHLSRRGRDLSRALSTLRTLGYAPTYDTPSGEKGDGVVINKSSYNQLNNDVVLLGNMVKISTKSADHLSSEVAFREYLNSLDILKNNYASYSKGNELAAQIDQIKSKGLTDVLISWLNSKQDKETGLWIKTGNSVDFDALNGAFKIISVYTSAERSCPNLNKIVEACEKFLKSQPKENFKTVCFLYNLWGTIDMAIDNAKQFQMFGNELNIILQDILINSDSYIQKSSEVIKMFIKEDGSSSYTPKASSPTSQGLPVALENMNEGDINGTVINLFSTLSYIYRVLDVTKVQPFGEAERMQFILEISKLIPSSKPIVLN